MNNIKWMESYMTIKAQAPETPQFFFFIQSPIYKFAVLKSKRTHKVDSLHLEWALWFVEYQVAKLKLKLQTSNQS